MKLSVLIFREIALRVKQIDKAEDKQNHGKQRGVTDVLFLYNLSTFSADTALADTLGAAS